jgi:hypothetical protein
VESTLIEVNNMKMHMSQFMSIANSIQMKVMKVISNLKNMIIKEFQHCVESKSIEAMMRKMQMIQYP